MNTNTISHVYPFLFCFFCFIFCVGDVLCTLYQVLYPGLIVTITGPDHLPSNDSARERKREDVLTTELVSMATDAVSSPIRPWANDCDRFLRVIFFLTSFIVILNHCACRHTSPWFTVNSRYYDGQHFILFDPEKSCDVLFGKVNDPITDASRNLCCKCFYSESQDFSNYFALRS